MIKLLPVKRKGSDRGLRLPGDLPVPRRSTHLWIPKQLYPGHSRRPLAPCPGYTSVAPKMSLETPQPPTITVSRDASSIRRLQVNISRDRIPQDTTSQRMLSLPRRGSMISFVSLGSPNVVHANTVHARCRQCLGPDHVPYYCPKCSSLGKSFFDATGCRPSQAC